MPEKRGERRRGEKGRREPEAAQERDGRGDRGEPSS